jgi:predicted phage baseplate assembly protein
MIYSCCNENRKAAVLHSATLNGIDYLEVLDSGVPPPPPVVPRQQTLLVHCLNPLPSTMTFAPANVVIEGGESIKNISVDWVIEAAAIDNTKPDDIKALLPVVTALADRVNVLVVRTHEAGDFSTYRLRLVNDAAQAASDPFAVTEVLTGFDPQLAEVAFSFKVECGPDFDCAPQPPNCSPTPTTPPPINYLAKDYGSFRTIMLDRLNQLLPGWGATSEADLGIALAELIAYVGDHLSYQQDALATEAYLQTARRRVSLRRHALLVDYHVRDGCNARAFLVVQVTGNAGQPVFLDRTQTRFYTFASGMPPSLAGHEEAALQAGVQVFEPMHDAVLYPEHLQLLFYTWGDANCCLPQGATEATLLGTYSKLQAGDVLIFQEVTGPRTGNPADADIRHRCAVRLTKVATRDGQGHPLVDPLFRDATGNPIAVTEIQWAQADALPFPLCISSTYLDSAGDQQPATNVSVAFGNVVLADHGLLFTGISLGTVPPPRLFYPRDPSADRCQIARLAPLPVRFRPTIPDRPLTQTVALATVPLPGAGIPVTASPVPLGPGLVVLADLNGFASLTLHATNPALWPQNFGVVASINAIHPQNFDLAIVYNPPSGAPGIFTQVRIETLTNLSLNTADANYVATQVNAHSKLIRVPDSYAPPPGPLSGFPAAPTMLPNAGTVEFKDLSHQAIIYLIVEPTDPATWPPLFGVQAKADVQDPARFDLSIVYIPSGVTVELFPGLSLADAQSAVATASQLIAVESFVQAPDPALSAHDLMNFDSRAAVPAITLTGTTVGGLATTWNCKPDLLESGESDPDFVVEVESDGTATLRFGDDTDGRVPDTGTAFVAAYRIGNGTSGNVGADSIVHLAAAANIQSCRNPLPATGGTDAETADQIRRRAPQAFLTQERAVTMADYNAMTELDPRVDRAAATLRWTGSWYTAFIAVEPRGGGNLLPALGTALKGELERYRLAGQDLELDSPQYVSLDIALKVCVDPDYFQSNVAQGLLQVLNNRILPDGRKGIFYPDNFTFGQTVYLSPIYAAARSVAGVVSVTATRFQPQGVDTNQYLDAGALKLGPLQVARLDNDRNFPDHGQLTLTMEGGK